MKNTIIVQKRVYGPGPIPGISVLVAVPGDEIDVHLARRLGLLDEEKPAKAEPAKQDKDEAPKSTPRASYPTKKSSGK